MKLICLEGIEHGNQFYTTHDENDKEPEKLADGTVAYRILGYANTDKEAREILYGPDCDNPINEALLIKNYLMTKPMPPDITEQDITEM